MIAVSFLLMMNMVTDNEADELASVDCYPFIEEKDLMAVSLTCMFVKDVSWHKNLYRHKTHCYYSSLHC